MGFMFFIIKLTVTTGFISITVQGISITESFLVGAILRMAVIASLIDATSLDSFLTNVNQLQAFFYYY